MRTSVFALAWAFVVVVSAYDVHFAWRYRAVFDAWELNPVARWVAGLFGLGALFAAKAALLVFAVAVAAYCQRLRHRLAVPYTLSVSGMHFVLSLHYLFG
jgi:hypothetical protein